VEYLKTLFSFAQNNVLYFYFLPLVVSLVAFIATSFTEYKEDVEAREAANQDTKKFYIPKIKLGTLVGRAIIAALPFVNIGSALYKSFFIARDIKDAAEKALDIPLVPNKK
jgi:hypothetical protein